jgi:hypothetical protein
MSSFKQLKGVCHNIAHHAVSGLSYVHPHLRRACRNVGLSSIIIDLGQNDPCPEQFKTIEPLRLSLHTLKEKFQEILFAEGFKLDDVKRIVLLFDFTDEFPDDYCSNRICVVPCKSSSGLLLCG